MNHSDAMTLGAAEKYFLGELTPNEREAFEEHYFSCQDCAGEMKALFVLKETVRLSPLTQSKVAREQARWWRWLERPMAARLSFAACGILAAVASYQNFYTFPRLRALEQPAFIRTIRAGQLRGEPSGATEFRVPLQFRSGFSQYRVQLQAEDGTVLAAIEASAPEVESSEGIGFRRTSRINGRVQIVLYGVNANLRPEELSRLPVEIP